ncbi:hypothetical protein [Aliivibrio kagoshimensis]|uniref:hypothetical protein n=1 Tax=Aliivibrio kagoshimensis TaxID=2910230 RepID=UPI003D14CB35
MKKSHQRIVTLSLVVLILIISAFCLLKWKHTSEVYGVTQNVVLSDLGETVHITVLLDDGREVVVPVRSVCDYVKQSRVLLRQSHHHILNYTHNRLMGFEKSTGGVEKIEQFRFKARMRNPHCG